MADLAKDAPASTPQTVYLQDYKPPAFLVDETQLHFELDPARTVVRNRMVVHRNAACLDPQAELVLHGKDVELQRLAIDGVEIGDADYRLEDEQLIIPGVADHAVIEVETLIHPESNTALEGLYVSSAMFCTQ